MKREFREARSSNLVPVWLLYLFTVHVSAGVCSALFGILGFVFTILIGSLPGEGQIWKFIAEGRGILVSLVVGAAIGPFIGIPIVRRLRTNESAQARDRTNPEE